jgi:gamma-glutamylcyclotransferase (GGCT)/AIG2-like uncharacterized protein YtfP
MINDLLFVYGTLLSTNNEFAKYLRQNATFYNTGKIKGRLYDMGNYPGVIANTGKDYDIVGSIYQLKSADAWKTIDGYESYGEGQPQPYLYIRKMLPVTTPDGVIEAWVYIYNLSVEGLVEIEGGDYQFYLKQK